MSTRSLFCLAICATVLTGCDKDDETSTTPNDGQTVNPVGALDRGAVLVTATVSTAPPVTVPGVPAFDITLDVPVALFYDGGTLVDAGEVSIDGQALGKQGNTYTIAPDFANPSTALVDYEDRTWSVSGGGSVPAIDATASRPQPSLGTVTAESEVVTGTPYTVSVSAITGADSVYYILGGVVKRFGGSTRTATFSADDIARAQSQGGQTVVQVAAFNTEERRIGDFPVFLIGEAVNNKSVSIN